MPAFPSEDRACLQGGLRPPACAEPATVSRNENPAFRRWFGRSRVVGDQGRPLVVYHGTNQSFSAFSRDRLGRNTASASSIEHCFTESAEEANEYAEMSAAHQMSQSAFVEKRSAEIQRQMAAAERRRNWDEVERLTLELEAVELGALNEGKIGQNIIPVFLRIENPMTIDFKGTFDGHQLRDAIAEARAKGHDGMRLLNVYDPVGPRPTAFTTTQWLAFSEEQIKSAIGNKGMFDPASPDICD